MLLIPFVSLLLQAPLQQSTVLEVRPEGAFFVQQPSTGVGITPASNRLAAVTSPRWQVNDGGLFWIGEHVAVGDSGAAAMGGKDLNNEGVACWATGSDSPIFDWSVVGASNVQVDIADRNNTGAAIVTTDTGGTNFESTVSAWDSAGSGTPDWSATFPTTGNVYASMIAVSDSGSRIVAAASNASGILHLRVWDRLGNSLGSWDLPASANMRFGAIDDAGERMYVGLYDGTVLIYDLNTGVAIHTISIGASFDSHAISGDGKTVAYGDFYGLTVVREV